MAGWTRSYYVDFVICIDATASMAPFLNKVKANALSFYQKFVDAMEEVDKDIDQLRIKVIAFRDYGYDDEPMVESKFFVLPEQGEEFKAFVEGIEAKGGGDISENALEALTLAIKSDWTTEGSWRRHLILLFSDAPALALGKRADCGNYPSGMPTDIAQLGAWWEGTDQSFTGTYQPNAGRFVAFVPNVEPWIELTYLNRYWPAFFAAGTGLSDVDIQWAIDMLVGAF